MSGKPHAYILIETEEGERIVYRMRAFELVVSQELRPFPEEGAGYVSVLRSESLVRPLSLTAIDSDYRWTPSARTTALLKEFFQVMADDAEWLAGL